MCTVDDGDDELVRLVFRPVSAADSCFTQNEWMEKVERKDKILKSSVAQIAELIRRKCRIFNSISHLEIDFKDRMMEVKKYTHGYIFQDAKTESKLQQNLFILAVAMPLQFDIFAKYRNEKLVAAWSHQRGAVGYEVQIAYTFQRESRKWDDAAWKDVRYNENDIHFTDFSERVQFESSLRFKRPIPSWFELRVRSLDKNGQFSSWERNVSMVQIESDEVNSKRGATFEPNENMGKTMKFDKSEVSTNSDMKIEIAKGKAKGKQTNEIRSSPLRPPSPQHSHHIPNNKTNVHDTPPLSHRASHGKTVIKDEGKGNIGVVGYSYSSSLVPSLLPFCLVCRDRTGKQPANVLFTKCLHMNTCSACYEDWRGVTVIECMTCESNVEHTTTRILDVTKPCAHPACRQPKNAVFGSCECFKFCLQHATDALGTPCPRCFTIICDVQRVVFPTI